MGFGTWELVGEGMYLAGFKSGDANFGTAGAVAGTLSHKHSIDPPDTTTGVPSEVLNDGVATGAAARVRSHTHQVNIDAFDSTTVSHMPPTYVAYFWKRTA